MSVLYGIVITIYLLMCIALIAAVSFQTSKNEGLGGTLGGKVEASPYVKKKTWEEQLDRVTGFLAWSFLTLSTVIVLFFQHTP